MMGAISLLIFVPILALEMVLFTTLVVMFLRWRDKRWTRIPERPPPSFRWWYIDGEMIRSYEKFQEITGCSDEVITSLMLKYGKINDPVQNKT